MADLHANHEALLALADTLLDPRFEGCDVRVPPGLLHTETPRRGPVGTWGVQSANIAQLLSIPPSSSGDAVVDDSVKEGGVDTLLARRAYWVPAMAPCLPTGFKLDPTMRVYAELFTRVSDILHDELVATDEEEANGSRGSSSASEGDGEIEFSLHLRILRRLYTLEFQLAGNRGSTFVLDSLAAATWDVNADWRVLAQHEARNFSRVTLTACPDFVAMMKYDDGAIVLFTRKTPEVVGGAGCVMVASLSKPYWFAAREAGSSGSKKKGKKKKKKKQRHGAVVGLST